MLGALIGADLPAPRTAALRALRDPDDGSLIDRALVLTFPAPASFTGEDVVELHVHGGPAVIDALLTVLARTDGLRLAEPGEFSRRAFDNGKLDLSQAEGLADLIGAQTDAQRRLALAQAGGRLRDKAEQWRSILIRCLAEAEAALDFAEEEADVAAGLDDRAAAMIAALRDEIARHLSDRIGERLRDGFTVAVVGEPNAGKSSIINALAKRDVAIVSAIPGTTRDIIELPLDLAGIPVTLVDTAGLRETEDPLEAEGIRRARARAEHADLVLHVVDARSSDMDALGQRVVNKIDLSGSAPGVHDDAIHVSARTGAGMAALETWLADWARSVVRTDESPLVTRTRHRVALEACVANLDEALAVAADPVLTAESLRLAARALGRITGLVAVEEVLDEIFGRFCIGK